MHQYAPRRVGQIVDLPLTSCAYSQGSQLVERECIAAGATMLKIKIGFRLLFPRRAAIVSLSITKRMQSLVKCA
jgi:hypothetical protein